MTWVMLFALGPAVIVGYVIGFAYERLRADKRHQEQLAAIRLARDSARSELIAAKLRIAELTRVYPFPPVSAEDERLVDELMTKRAAKLSERPMRVPAPTVPVATIHHEGPVFPNGSVDPCGDDPEAA